MYSMDCITDFDYIVLVVTLRAGGGVGGDIVAKKETTTILHAGLKVYEKGF